MNVIIWDEKSGIRITPSSPADMLRVLGERYKQGYWYDNYAEDDPKTEWADRAKKIHELQDENAAKNFIYERRNHEYENFRIEPIT